ncbi:hypothetical protein HOY80DRAFT_943408 [Tuber brumale]|nr:hypothetical protein HOY80DRAFT_943408 [Tuber brumale]
MFGLGNLNLRRGGFQFFLSSFFPSFLLSLVQWVGLTVAGLCCTRVLYQPGAESDRKKCGWYNATSFPITYPHTLVQYKYYSTVPSMILHMAKGWRVAEGEELSTTKRNYS